MSAWQGGKASGKGGPSPLPPGSGPVTQSAKKRARTKAKAKPSPGAVAQGPAASVYFCGSCGFRHGGTAFCPACGRGQKGLQPGAPQKFLGPKPPPGAAGFINQQGQAYEPQPGPPQTSGSPSPLGASQTPKSTPPAAVDATPAPAPGGGTPVCGPPPRESELALARAAVEQAKTWRERIRMEQGGELLLEAAEANVKRAVAHLTALRSPAERLQVAQDRLRSHQETKERLEGEISRHRAALTEAEGRLAAVSAQVQAAEADAAELAQAFDAWEAEQAEAADEPAAAGTGTSVAAALNEMTGALGARLAAASRARGDMTDTEPAWSEDEDVEADRSTWVRVRQVEQLVADQVSDILRSLFPGQVPGPARFRMDVDAEGRPATKRKATSQGRPAAGDGGCGHIPDGAAVYGPPPGPGPPTPGGEEDPLGLATKFPVP